MPHQAGPQGTPSLGAKLGGAVRRSKPCKQCCSTKAGPGRALQAREHSWAGPLGTPSPIPTAAASTPGTGCHWGWLLLTHGHKCCSELHGYSLQLQVRRRCAQLLLKLLALRACCKPKN